MKVTDLQTPALLVDAAALEHNLATMAAALPGPRLRPHVKAHKTTELARGQAAHGHRAFTCATIREVEGMVAAGLGDDLLLANEVLDARRLGALADRARITVAVDSAELEGWLFSSKRPAGAPAGAAASHGVPEDSHAA